MVIQLREQVETLKREKLAAIEPWQKAVRERDDLLAAEKVRLQTEILA